MRPPHVRRRPNVSRPAAALLALGVIACSDGPLNGPGLPGRGASLRLEPRVEPRASVAAAGISQVHVAIARVPDGLVVLDSVVDLAGASGAELDLAVPLASSSDRFAVRLAAADAAGDTIFRASDTTEVVRGPTTPSLELLLRYAGPDTAVARIVAGPDTAVLDAGGSAPLWVVGYPAGTDDATPLAHVAWRSGDETVVRVSRTGGRVTAIAPGRAAWVYATTVTGLVDSARVVVRHVLAAIEPSPASLALAPGGRAQVAAGGRAADGTALPAQAVAWSSSDTTVAVVDGAGHVLGVGVGSATITAASGGARADVPVVVAAPAVAALELAPSSVSLVRLQRAQLVATPRLAGGAVAHGRTATWTSSDADVATVDGDGLVSAVGVGIATVTATVEGRSASAEVEVSPLPADRVVASPATVRIVAGGSMMLGATVTDAAGEPVPNTPIAWTSSDERVALVSSAGQLTAVAPGSATVTASVNGRTGTVAVDVVPPPVAALVLSRPDRFDLVVGASTDLDATPRAASGAPLAGRLVEWASSDPGVATIDADGGVVAVSVGSAHLSATSEGVAASVRVDVVPVPVASVEMATPTLGLLVGRTFQLNARALDAQGRLLAGRTAAWSSSDPGVVQVTSDGLVTAEKAGAATVTATIEGHAATTAVSVTSPEPGAAVAFTPGGAQYALGQTMTAQMVGVTAGAGPRTLQLSSSKGGIASVQQTVAVSGTTPAPFTVTGLALGPVRLQGATAYVAPGATDVEVVPARLRAEGWAGGALMEGGYRRIIIRAGGADGAASGAVFAEATEFRFDYSDSRIDLYLDKDGSPTRTAGPIGGSAQGSSINRNTTVVRAPVGRSFFSVIIKGKSGGTATLTVRGPAGRYVPLELRDLRVLDD